MKMKGEWLTSAARKEFSLAFSFFPLGSLPRSPMIVLDFCKAEGLGASALAADTNAASGVSSRIHTLREVGGADRLRGCPRRY